jgi:hypothetical protein
MSNALSEKLDKHAATVAYPFVYFDSAERIRGFHGWRVADHARSVERSKSPMS